MRRLKKILFRLFHGRKIFPSYAETIKFLRLSQSSKARASETVELKIAALRNAPIICRNGTADREVVWNVFFNAFHLPEYELPPSATILDIGANIGLTCAHFCVLYPQATVYGVEMDLSNYELALKNTHPFRARCQLILAAVSGTAGKVFYTGQRTDGLHICADNEKNSDRLEVKAVTMQDLIKELRLEKIDYLKMDIEGAEYALFAADLEWLDKIEQFKIEIHRPYNFAAFEKIFAARGFEFDSEQRHSYSIFGRRRKRAHQTGENA